MSICIYSLGSIYKDWGIVRRYDMLLNEYPRVVNGSGIIDEINDWFYGETNRGREYNNYMIWEYINALESNIPGLEIWWYDF